MIAAIQQFVRVVDDLSSRAYLSVFEERGGILAFLFHSLFRDARLAERNAVTIQERDALHRRP